MTFCSGFLADLSTAFRVMGPVAECGSAVDGSMFYHTFGPPLGASVNRLDRGTAADNFRKSAFTYSHSGKSGNACREGRSFTNSHSHACPPGRWWFRLFYNYSHSQSALGRAGRFCSDHVVHAAPAGATLLCSCDILAPRYPQDFVCPPMITGKSSVI